MGFINSQLLPQEKVVYQARLHWFVFLRPIATTAFVLALGIGLSAYQALEPVEPYFVAVGALACLFAWLKAFAAYATAEFGVTDKRLLIKTGLIRRRTAELLLGKVEAIRVDQSIAGRLFNYGTVTLCGTGGTQDPFDGISRPLDFRRQAQGQIARVQDQA